MCVTTPAATLPAGKPPRGRELPRSGRPIGPINTAATGGIDEAAICISIDLRKISDRGSACLCSLPARSTWLTFSLRPRLWRSSRLSCRRSMCYELFWLGKSLRLAARRNQAVPTLAAGGEGAGLRDKGRRGLCDVCAAHVAESKSGGGPD